MTAKLGIIGGSGLYALDALSDANWITVDSPWGSPSDAFLCGEIAGVEVAFLPRHGRGHRLSPDAIPYRANIDAMKRLGVTDLVSVSACGSFREDMAPGHIVLPDQFIDRTFQRPPSFFGAGCVAHVSLAQPTCARLADLCEATARDLCAAVHRNGTYLAMEGPQFSTRAESRLYREVWGADIIGMTNMPEARLSREAELCYITIAMVTDYDCWHPDHGAVDVSEVIATLTANVATARDLVARLPAGLATRATPCPCGCDRALDHAIMTTPDTRDPALLSKLDAVAGRVLS